MPARSRAWRPRALLAPLLLAGGLAAQAAAPTAASPTATSASAFAATPWRLPAEAQAGDLIFREGTETISDIILGIDPGGYSHVGMLLGSAGNWQVLHATPSEVAGRPDGVVIDTLDFFLDPVRARRHAVYQVRADDAAQREQAVRRARAALGRPFRMADDSGTYCTRLVWQAWQDAGLSLAARFRHLDLPLIPGDYLLPSGLIASPRLRALTQDAPD
ncbi:YiiX/YebB-like N1pC/P60 family cysteine hydrolase [Orrella dioscoreae]|uniref:YiiX/YebB-like N1pC/P60 family cysteine hydrolase n=1 Tax=Orrella dioscoreae TaxID=1851544 RepID=UPI0009F5D71A|nr:YiiX/YebB-like N1pC/P60 family cysteine hydrolase [Orrella dioscoreae]